MIDAAHGRRGPAIWWPMPRTKTRVTGGVKLHLPAVMRGRSEGEWRTVGSASFGNNGLDSDMCSAADARARARPRFASDDFYGHRSSLGNPVFFAAPR